MSFASQLARGIQPSSLSQLMLPPPGPALPPEARAGLIAQFLEEPKRLAASELQSLEREMSGGRLSAEQLLRLAERFGTMPSAERRDLPPGLRSFVGSLATRLIPLLGSEHEQIRERALQAISGLGMDAAPALVAPQPDRLTSNPTFAEAHRLAITRIAEEHGRFLARQFPGAGPRQMTALIRETDRLAEQLQSDNPMETYLARTAGSAFLRTLTDQLVSGLTGETPELQRWARRHLSGIGDVERQMQFLFSQAQALPHNGCLAVARGMLSEIITEYVQGDEQTRNRLRPIILRCQREDLQHCVGAVRESLRPQGRQAELLLELLRPQE